MSRNYLNPPLIEALCEFQFDGEAWDWTIPGLIYQEIKEEFPIKRHAPSIELEVQARPSEIGQRASGGPGKMQFARADETALIQIGPHLLTINHLEPYPHWRHFKPMILKNFEVYHQVAAPTGLKRVGLRYINRISIPETEFNLSTYFSFGPRLPEALSTRSMGSVFLRVDLLDKPDLGHLLLTLGTAPEAKENQSTFILDLDFATASPGTVMLEGVDMWIEQAHDRIEEAFEACLTDKLREVFEEVEP